MALQVIFLGIVNLDNILQVQDLLLSMRVTGHAGQAGPVATDRNAPGRVAVTKLGSSELYAEGRPSVKITAKCAH